MSLQVTLKDPEFNDADNLLLDVKVMDMMDGSIRTRVSTPVPIKLSLQFIELTRVKAIELRDFLTASLGQKVRYVDYSGQHWAGYITNEPSVTTTGRGGGSSERQESNSVKIEFEGVKL